MYVMHLIAISIQEWGQLFSVWPIGSVTLTDAKYLSVVGGSVWHTKQPRSWNASQNNFSKIPKKLDTIIGGKVNSFRSMRLIVKRARFWKTQLKEYYIISSSIVDFVLVDSDLILPVVVHFSLDGCNSLIIMERRIEKELTFQRKVFIPRWDQATRLSNDARKGASHDCFSVWVPNPFQCIQIKKLLLILPKMMFNQIKLTTFDYLIPLKVESSCKHSQPVV